MIQILERAAESLTGSYAFYSAGVSVKQASSVSVAAAVTNSAPAAGTFTAAVTDIITKATHGYLLGLKVQFTTTTTLPAGLSLSTDYFVIPLTVNTFKVADTLAHAIAGTNILDITDTGTGTHTVTPVALAGSSLKLQGCLDDVLDANSVWSDLPIKATGDATKSASITATANFNLSDKHPEVNWVRSYFALTAGQLAVAQTTLVKGVA